MTPTTETDPWWPEETQTGTAPVITAEMTGTASMVIQRMYSSDDPGEVQSGRAVVQVLYPLIAHAERERLRAELQAERDAQDEIASGHAELGHDRETERAYGQVEALDGVLAMIGRAETTAAEAGKD